MVVDQRPPQSLNLRFTTTALCLAYFPLFTSINPFALTTSNLGNKARLLLFPLMASVILCRLWETRGAKTNPRWIGRSVDNFLA